MTPSEPLRGFPLLGCSPAAPEGDGTRTVGRSWRRALTRRSLWLALPGMHNDFYGFDSC